MPNVPSKRGDIGRHLAALAMEDRGGIAEIIAGMSLDALAAGGIHRKVFTFGATALAMADNAGVIAWKATKLFTFPKGTIKILGASLQAVTGKSSAGIVDTFRATFGLGTVAADNTNTLAGTEQNIIPSTTMAAAVAGVGALQGFNAADIAPLDGNTTAAAVFLNLLINDADHDITTTPANLILTTGTLTLMYADLGQSKP